jgi:hypothetical protein
MDDPFQEVAHMLELLENSNVGLSHIAQVLRKPT